jgi:hypothetical protein
MELHADSYRHPPSRDCGRFTCRLHESSSVPQTFDYH